MRLENPPEPREPSGNVVELSGFRVCAKDASIIAQQHERVPGEQLVSVEIVESDGDELSCVHTHTLLRLPRCR